MTNAYACLRVLRMRKNANLSADLVSAADSPTNLAALVSSRWAPLKTLRRSLPITTALYVAARLHFAYMGHYVDVRLR